MRFIWGLVVLAALSRTSVAKDSPASNPMPPKPLPAVVADAPAVTGSALLRFDPERITLKKVEHHWQIWAETLLLKDFGGHEAEAREALRLIRDLHFNQYSTIAGAIPSFEFWLADNEAVKSGLVVKHLIPFNQRALKVENIAGAWVIRDDKMLLYNFGNQQEAAEQALAQMKKFGFNQLGVIGIPTPVMTYLTVDSYGRAPQRVEQTDVRELINQVAQQGLMLPNFGYAGSKMAIERRKLEVIHSKNEWDLMHGKDVICRFGPNQIAAREALHLMQDSQITEMCRIGKNGFTIFLSSGQAPRQSGLGFNNIRMQPANMKIKIINNLVCLVEDDRVVFELGDNRNDAELVLKVLQHFHFDQICPIGDPSQGMRILVRSR